MPGVSSISGIISGLQTQEILDKLRQVEMASVNRLQAQKSTLNQRLTTWQSLNTKLLALKTAISPLTLPHTFSARSVSISDESALSAAASSSAPEGSITFNIISLASTHQLGSQGYANAETLVGDGTITINGKQIATNGLSLSGLRDAINASGAGVRAAIIDTGAAQDPYKLVLTSNTSGAAGAISCNVSLTGGAPPTFTTVAEAQDAHLQLGSGASAVDIYRSSNHIDDVWSGVTLDLKRTSASPVTISIASDTSAIKEKVKEFITAYNEVMKFIDEQQKYDQKTETSSPLFGDTHLLNLQERLYRAVSQPIEGLSAQLSLLSQVGVRRNLEGELTLEEAALDQALKSDGTGVLKLFSAYAECASGGVSYGYSTADTKASGPEGYSLEITRAAARARVTAGVAQTGPLAADETLTINGADIFLTAGMTQDAVVHMINAASSRTGLTASLTGADGTGAGNYLTLTRLGYGSALGITAVSSLSSAGGTTSGIGNLLVTQESYAGESGSGTGAAGVDVAGLIDGVAYEGTGSRLTATSGEANGLSLVITAGVGVKEPVIFTRGALSALGDELVTMLETSGGAYRVATDGLQKQIEAVDDDIEHAQSIVDSKMERLERQFAAMESALAKLQSQGSYLESQLAQFSKSS